MHSRTARLFALFLLLLFWLPLTAQKLDHRLGEWVVQLEEGITPATLSRSYSTRNFTGDPSDYHFIPLLPKSNIYKCVIDYRNINEIEALEDFRSLNGVVHAQFNYLIEWRKRPNDPMYDLQWHWWNTGQKGDPAGVDLQMEEVWQYTTGGVTSEGDTIVLCIIDGGFDAEHEDIAPNHWRNLGEIPGNGIDDDDNGYVDDYRGWNVSTNDDQIRGSGTHGTGVAGLAGARGNNDKGITGLNWEVKMMLVAGISDIASVLQAYAYPLRMRQMYNQTNGNKGAFVVVTNASWGIPNLFEQDAPLWCAFYDSLGQAGILSCGAAPNRAVNIDKVGDLPSNCTSEYYIGVTNVTREDMWYNHAGYGPVSIDLGAYGQETFTTGINNSYREFGGTSAATPIVSGAIALLYARDDCNNLALLARRTPPLAALTTRQLLLDNTFARPSLTGKCSTGGRIDLLHAMEQTHPFFLLEATDTSAMLSWAGLLDTLDSLEYRESGDTTWKGLGSQTRPLVLSGLRGCTPFEVRGYGLCDQATGLFRFLTPGCCTAPCPIEITHLDTTSVHLEWENIYAARSYRLHLMTFLPSDTLEQEISMQPNDTGRYTLTALTGCTRYGLVVVTDCGDSTSIPSDTLRFRTKGCGACLDLSYCLPSVLPDAEDDRIAQLSLNNVQLLPSGALVKGYEIVTSSDVELTFCAPNDMQINGPSSSSEIASVWIDFDHNGHLDTAERVYRTSLPSKSPYTFTFFIPNTAHTGSTRMRVALKWTGFDALPPTPCGDNIEFGQVIDFCISIADHCSVSPSLPEVDTSTAGQTLVTWSPCAPNRMYRLSYILPDSTPVSIETGDTFFLIRSLPPCADLSATLLQRCTQNDSAEWSPATPFRINSPCGPSLYTPPLTSSWTLSPNPAHDFAVLTLPGARPPIQWQLVDLHGRLHCKGASPTLPCKLRIDLDGLSKGLYFVKVQSGGQNRVFPILALPE